MKKLGMIGFFALLMFAKSALANCYMINDNDTKNLCLAKESNSATYCYMINNEDNKNFCLAMINKSQTYCYMINDSDKKNFCLSSL